MESDSFIHLLPLGTIETVPLFSHPVMSRQCSQVVTHCDCNRVIIGCGCIFGCCVVEEGGAMVLYGDAEP